MVRLIKWSFILVFFALIGIIGYAFLGDLSAPGQDVSKRVTIEVQ